MSDCRIISCANPHVRPKKICGTDARIVSYPVSVNYSCPYCGEDVSEPYDSFTSDIHYGYYITSCPECGKSVELEEVEYD